MQILSNLFGSQNMIPQPVTTVKNPNYATTYSGLGGNYTKVGWHNGYTDFDIVYPPKDLDLVQAIRKQALPIGTACSHGPGGLYTTVTYRHADETYKIVYPPEGVDFENLVPNATIPGALLYQAPQAQTGSFWQRFLSWFKL